MEKHDPSQEEYSELFLEDAVSTLESSEDQVSLQVDSQTPEHSLNKSAVSENSQNSGGASDPNANYIEDYRLDIRLVKIDIRLKNFYYLAPNESKTDFLVTFSSANLNFTREKGVDKSSFKMEQLALKDILHPNSYILTFGEQASGLQDRVASHSSLEQNYKIVEGSTTFHED